MSDESHSESESHKIESGRVHRYVAKDFTFRASFLDATEIVKHMRDLQKSAPVPTRAMGRTLIGAALMASHLKGNQSVGVYIRGDGPLQSVFAEASFDGQVRAYTPQSELVIDTDPGFGKGFISVQRDVPFQKTPYNGTVELLTGDIQDDIMYYLKQSQQIRCLIELDVRIDNVGRIHCASGILIEVMPGVEQEIFSKIVHSSRSVPKLIDEVMAGKSAEEIVQPYLGQFEFVEIDHPYPLEYSCRCNIEKVRTTLAMLGEEQMKTIIDEGEPINVRCQICGAPYHFGLDEVKALINQLNKDSMH